MLVALVVIICVLLLLFTYCLMTVAKDADERAEAIYSTYTPTPTAEPVSEDVYLLAKIMQCEAGVNWADWAVMLIGEVVMNRVESPRFPDTVREVIYADNPVQYEPVYSAGWEEFEPDPEYIDLAERLINGERPLGDKDMVFQALFPQGTGTLVTYYDRTLQTITYFCKG